MNHATPAAVFLVDHDKPRLGFWRRRIVDPLIRLLRHGTSPEELARALAAGTVCSLFPFFGTTSALNLLVGWWQKLNQPVMQTVNQLLGPAQLAMIVVYVWLGEWIWGVDGPRFSVTEMLTVFRDASWGDFLRHFGWAGIHAFTAWALTAPVIAGAVYVLLRPVIRRVAAGARSPDANA